MLKLIYEIQDEDPIACMDHIDEDNFWSCDKMPFDLLADSLRAAREVMDSD